MYDEKIKFYTCGGKTYCINGEVDTDAYYACKISELKPPVKLIGKSKTFGMYSVTLVDSTGTILQLGELVGIADNIGQTHEVGDIIIP